MQNVVKELICVTRRPISKGVKVNVFLLPANVLRNCLHNSLSMSTENCDMFATSYPYCVLQPQGYEVIGLTRIVIFVLFIDFSLVYIIKFLNKEVLRLRY